MASRERLVQLLGESPRLRESDSLRNVYIQRDLTYLQRQQQISRRASRNSGQPSNETASQSSLSATGLRAPSTRQIGSRERAESGSGVNSENGPPASSSGQVNAQNERGRGRSFQHSRSWSAQGRGRGRGPGLAHQDRRNDFLH